MQGKANGYIGSLPTGGVWVRSFALTFNMAAVTVFIHVFDETCSRVFAIAREAVALGSPAT